MNQKNITQFNIISHIARFTWMESTRNRLFLLLSIAAVSLGLLGLFVGDLTITESQSTQAIVVGSILRIIAFLTISLFVATSMLRERSDRQIDLLLALPLNRSTYYWGKWLGFALLAIMVSMILCIPLLIIAPTLNTLLWVGSLCCELLIVSSISLLMLITFNQLVPSMLGIIAFYTLARSLNVFQLIAENPIQEIGGAAHGVIVFILKAINTLFPNLDQFAQGQWLAYGVPSAMEPLNVLLQTVIYCGLLSAASLFDLYRKSL